MEDLRLNLGAGDTVIDGYMPVDRKFGSEIYPLAYADSSADAIRASHCLEHFSHRKTLDVLREWVRVLKPGGEIQLAVPNLDWCRERLNADDQQFPIEAYLMGGHVDENDHHGALFTERKLRLLMRMAGLNRVRHWKSEIQDCASLPVSLNLQGTKPTPVDLKGIPILVSVPRYMPSGHVAHMYTAISALGLVPLMGFGVFWHQALTRIIEEAIATGAEFLFTVDFDTLFQPDDVRELYRLIKDRPDVDAIFPLQLGRGGASSPLLNLVDEKGQGITRAPLEWFDQTLLKAHTGHFGLTVFRASAFAKLSKPWFVATPDENGSWGEGRIDCDVNFWRMWNEKGNSLYLAPLVPVGHLEEVSLHADRNMNPLMQEISEWRKFGLPLEVIR